MYPITEAVKALFEAEQRKVLRITGTDKNGTSISITDDNVMEDSFQIDRYSCNGEKLEVGTAIAAQMSFTLENGDGTYDGIVFEDTELFVEVGVADWTHENPTIYWVPCGYFTPDMQPRRLSTISVTALDRITKFDVVVDAADLTFPATIAGLVSQVCTLCGVTLAQSISGLTNAAVVVSDLPTVQGDITYRNLIQWCAGIMGTNAWFDWNGQLRFSWYNNATEYVSTMDNRYSSDLYEDDLTITGVEYTNDSGIAVVEGTDDYAIDLTGNAIAGPLIATVLPPLNTALNGFTYRPFTAAVVNAPYLWPMDIVTFTDKTGNNHTSVLTNVVFGLNGTTAMESNGMTYAINKAAQPKGFTREQARLINIIAQESIKAVDVEYAQNQSTTDAPTSGWSTDAPQWREGYYIWQRTATTTVYGTSYSDPTCISGRDGRDGSQGETGIGVSAIVEEYYLSTSSSDQTDGSWSTAQPQWVSGKYIWTRSKVTWTNNTTTYTAPVLAQAINGANSTANAARAAVTALDNSLTQQEIFDRLTDNGAAQGLVLYNGQLYVNASYINTGYLNVGRINFNDPPTYYDVPDENDVDSLFNGQTVVDGWIVNASGTDEITIISCGFALPLRGKTVSVTFEYNGNLWGGSDSWYGISDEAELVGGLRDWEMPAGRTPINPYTLDFYVDNDMMGFSMSVECSGVRRISVSLDSPVTPAKDIVYDYQGQRIGSFHVYRDGTLETDGKSLFVGPVRIGKLYLEDPLDVDYGGTGAGTAADARTNLGITPANIGAVAKAGDNMTGPLNIRNTLLSHCIELIPPVGVGNGGYVDFAYNGEEVDYTSRIIENQRGVLDVNGVTFQNGNLTGRTNGYSWDLDTEDTINTWVPVLINGFLKHRVLPKWLNNINTVPVDHGGTGATSAAGARANLGATAVLNLDASTVAGVYAQITAAMPNNGDLAAFYAPSAVMGLITKVGSGAAKIPYAVQGVIRRAQSQIYDIFASAYHDESYSGRITFSNGSSISAAKIYKHTGTEV